MSVREIQIRHLQHDIELDIQISSKIRASRNSTSWKEVGSIKSFQFAFQAQRLLGDPELIPTKTTPGNGSLSSSG